MSLQCLGRLELLELLELGAHFGQTQGEQVKKIPYQAERVDGLQIHERDCRQVQEGGKAGPLVSLNIK